MVLLNGVKYACERCIRGHRVSSCTHTDKLLTMIKPKGRPASQCAHCREQRKLKNTHSSCNCGKKGKPPGTHLASCLCHRNSHCTCPNKDKKASSRKKSETSPVSGSETAPTAAAATTTTTTPTAAVVSLPQHSNPLEYLYEDLNSQFDSTLGLLDYLVELDVLGFDHGIPPIPATTEESRPNSSMDSESILQDARASSVPFQGLNIMTNSPSDAELDAMENMFPLFPLVGSSSFDNDKSLPLLAIPDRALEGNHVINRHLDDKPKAPHHIHTLVIPNSSTGSNDPSPKNAPTMPILQTLQLYPNGIVFSNSLNSNISTQSTQATTPHLSQGQSSQSLYSANGAQAMVSPIASSVHVFKAEAPAPTLSAASHGNPQLKSSPSMSVLSSAGAIQPHPLKASSSFTIGSTNPKPCRPESVLSLASTLSNTSKQNLLETTPQINQHGFPKIASTTAFPPFLLSGNNSTDDFTFQSHNSLSMAFNDSQLLMFLSDEEHTQGRPLNGFTNGFNTYNTGNGGSTSNITVNSGTTSVGTSANDGTLPLRQSQPLRRTSSLSRSYSQHHHNPNALKDNLTHIPLKSGISIESSPRLGPIRIPPNFSERSFHKPSHVDTFVAEEEEDLLMANMGDAVGPGNYVQDTHGEKNEFEGNIPLDFQDFKSIPMYLDIFDGIVKHS